MKKRNSLMLLILALSLPIMMLGVGCGSDDDITNGNGDDGDGNCDSLVLLANDSLGNQLNHAINVTLDNPDSSFRPRDIDFSGVHGLYQSALALEAGCTDAKFGLAFTSLMLFLTDPTLNDFIDRVKNMTDTIEFNPARHLPGISIGGDLAPAGIPLGIGSMGGILPDLTRADRMIMSAAANDPAISEAQAILETELLPKVVAARIYLAQIAADPSYTFELSPEMQGNDGANPIVLDNADFRVFLATAYAAEAALNVFLARDLDLTQYGLDGANVALERTSSFLSLKAGNYMPTAKARILSAESQVELAIDALIAEVTSDPDQTNDLIKVYPSDIADLNELKDTLAYFRTYFNGPKQLEVTWESGDYWNGTDLVPTYDTFSVYVDIAKFFDSPMNNPKLFLPAYTITLDTFIVNYQQFAADHWSRTRYWYHLDSLFGIRAPNDSAGLPWFPYSLPAADDSLFYRRLADGYGGWAADQFVFGWDDLSYHGGDYTNQWSWGTGGNSWEYGSLYWDGNELYVVACYSWTANSYAEWTFPEATFGGLFPQWTSDTIKTRMELDPLDWIKADCDTLNFGNDDNPVGPGGGW